MKKAYKIRIVFAMWVIVFSLTAFLAAYYITRNYYEIEDDDRDDIYDEIEDYDVVETTTTPLFLLVDKEGYVSVEYFQGGGVYDETNILVIDLPESIQEKIKGGIPIDNFEQLYDFLENYSS